MRPSSDVTDVDAVDGERIEISTTLSPPPVARGAGALSPSEMRVELQLLPEFAAEASTSADAHVLVPDNAIAHVGACLSASYLESARERDFLNPKFRDTILGIHELLNNRVDRHAHSISTSEIVLRETQARVHFVVMPNGLGKPAFIHALQKFLGSEHGHVNVRLAPDKAMRYARLESVHIPVSLAKSPQHIGRYIARCIDSKFNSGLAAMGRGRLFRDECDADISIPAILLAVHAGAIIVGPVYTRDVHTRAAEASLTMLARVAEATGIPMVIVATSGAAVGFMEHTKSQGTLSCRGAYSVEPLAVESAEWENVALIVWMKHLAPGSTPPAWFAVELWRATFGRIELAVKLCAFIAGAWRIGGREKLTEKSLAGYASSALILEQPYLAALHRAELGGKFSRGAVLRYGDWLPLETVCNSFPSLDSDDDYSVVKNHLKRLARGKLPYGSSPYQPVYAERAQATDGAAGVGATS